jgi:hypothetical protein
MRARESGDWQGTAQHGNHLGPNESEVADVYRQAMQWTRQINAG